MLKISPQFTPSLQPGFVPAALWNRAYRERVAASPGRSPIALALVRPDGRATVWRGELLPASHPQATLNFRYVERTLKFLLWQRGGCCVRVAGAPEMVAHLQAVYSAEGARAFDQRFLGEEVYGRTFQVEACAWSDLPENDSAELGVGRHLEGCRIGFDLGGSACKVAALMDGQVVWADQINWDPYFQADPTYHLGVIQTALQQAASHLPRVDAIGGSAAGVYVNNEVRVASLFRGVPRDRFEASIRRMFFDLQKLWNGIPFEVVNDGEVAALAGSMSLGANAVLGLSFGTSLAGGYVTPTGGLSPWLNELAFAPIDYADDAPVDEWSGDRGCGVQYFSQQGLNRLAGLAGIEFPPNLPLSERRVVIDPTRAPENDPAVAVFKNMGLMLGYTLAHYADFYPLRHLLLLGGVTANAAGGLILEQARQVLASEFPRLAAELRLSMLEGNDRRHAQAIAAASLAAVGKA